ncbi:MAG: hypothetical protein OEX12_07035 [Gammaproteobacteria bacterium]|nr:hypothetical protein [Gammaproteobacteria bacterium]
MKKYLIIALALVLAGSYVAVYKWAVAKTEAQHSEDVARVVSEALKAYQKEVADANTKNFDLMQKAQLDSQRIKQLRKRMDNLASSCRLSPDSIQLFNETIRDKRLQPSSNPFILVGERDSAESICLTAIGEANRVKIKLNNLIDNL